MDNSELIKKFVIAHLKRYVYEIDFLIEVIRINGIKEVDERLVIDSLVDARLSLQEAMDMNFDDELVKSTEMFQ